jgi:formylglycine-generating enzyme required for sulfatase activity
MKSISIRISLTTLLTVLLLLPTLFPAILEAQNERMTLRQSNGQPINKLPDKSKRYALVVGVDEYQDQDIAGLKGAANDARLLAKTLIENAGFDANNVKVVATGEPLGRQPTRGNILSWLNRIQNNMPKDGLLLFSFAGHGMERGGKAYLLPTDAQIGGDLGLLEDTSINVEAMSERIRNSGIKQVMLVLDACRNNPEGRGLDHQSNNKLTSAYTKGFDFEARNQNIEAFVKLYSTSIGELAYEDKEKDQGYFTYALVEALKGAAANEKGEVTLASLVKYVQEQVPKRIQSDYGKSKSQRPWADMQGYKADELVFSITIRVEIAGRKPTGTDAATIELEFWNSVKGSSDAADFREYLKQYPNGSFAGLARNKLRQLEEAAKRTSDAEAEKRGMKSAATNPPANSANDNTPANPPPSNPVRQENVEIQTITETVNRVGIEMVLVPAGKFLTCYPQGDDDSYRKTTKNEITISKPFYMGKYEVTQLQWRAVSALPKVSIALPSDPSKFKGDNLPVEQVSWDEAVEFCKRLLRATGKTYRLPTAAEWEYACRAGTSGMYAGSLDAMAWYENNSGNTTHPVGQKQANRFGLYDMHGNVLEWCNDVYERNYERNYGYWSPAVDPQGPSTGDAARVARGGDWYSKATLVQAAFIDAIDRSFRYGYLGFRLLRNYN